MRTLLKIISLTLLATISLFANVQKIDECKVDVYYANGIMIDMNVTQAKHELRWNDMVDDMFISNPEEYKKIASAKIAYNASQGFFDDVFESAEQVMSNEWGWKKFSVYFRVYLENHNIQEKYDTHIPDLTAQVKAYKESIILGHGVIVIAHSQGNYYTNEAYEELDDWMKAYFHMFGVATPANHVAGFAVDDASAPYVLFHNDFINFIATALPSNLDDTRHHGFPSIDAHDFYESYMKEETSKKMIKDFIIDEIHKHSSADSQWEVDQELNKGTKDYRITVKHRFDPNITSMQGIEVYPFNASKKLYHVLDNTGGNGWVKASCGGEEVFDYWDGKKDDETYYLEGTGERIAIYKILPIQNLTISYHFRKATGSTISKNEIFTRLTINNKTIDINNLDYNPFIEGAIFYENTYVVEYDLVEKPESWMYQEEKFMGNIKLFYDPNLKEIFPVQQERDEIISSFFRFDFIEDKKGTFTMNLSEAASYISSSDIDLDSLKEILLDNKIIE